jgi:hypothetical protein
LKKKTRIRGGAFFGWLISRRRNPQVGGVYCIACVALDYRGHIRVAHRNSPPFLGTFDDTSSGPESPVGRQEKGERRLAWIEPKWGVGTRFGFVLLASQRN